MDITGHDVDDLGQFRASGVARQQLPTFPEPRERPEHLAVTNLQPPTEQVHVEFDRVGDPARRSDGRRQVAGSVSDPLHDTTLTDGGRFAATGAGRSGWHVEAGITVGGAVAYFGGRFLVEGERTEAIENAQRLMRLERTLGIDVEQGMQRNVLDHDLLRVAGNLSYVWLHWPLLIAVLLLLFARDRTRFRRLRDALLWSGAVGLIIFATVPVAPPRFMPGFVGTVSDDARRHYLAYPIAWSNQFAAVPSFHVGWTLVACLAIAGLTGRRLGKLVALLPAVLVAVSVVTTGNHYVVDALLGTLIAVIAYAMVMRRDRAEPV